MRGFAESGKSVSTEAQFVACSARCLEAAPCGAALLAKPTLIIENPVTGLTDLTLEESKD
jgi:hypothetical protein